MIYLLILLSIYVCLGLDLDCGDYYSNFTESAVAQGIVRESYIDTALKNLYTVLMRLGFFDGMPKYESLAEDDICTKDNIELAADAARQGIVLLKNDHNILPLCKDKYKKLALVGPHTNATEAMIGNYEGFMSLSSQSLLNLVYSRLQTTLLCSSPQVRLAVMFPLSMPSLLKER